MAEELFDILIKGPGPYGFRLFGGNDDPLIVAKLRARSKAHDAGLREGDVVLGINSRCLHRVSHGIAMALLENAQESLHLHLYRGPTDRNSVLAVYNKIGHQLRPVSPGTAPPNRSVAADQPSSAPVEPTASQRVQVPVQPSEPDRPGEIENQQGNASYSKQEVTSSEGNWTQRITTETQDLGGVTLTKVTRHVVTGPDSGAIWTSTDEPNTTKKTTLFHVPKVKAQPLLWSPDGTAASGHFQVNKGITVEFSSVEGKENVIPNTERSFGGPVNVSEESHKFKVYKTTAKPLVWQPSNVPSLPVREPSPSLAFKIIDSQDYQSERKHEEEPTKRYKVEDGVGSEDPFGLNPHLIHVLTTEGTHEDFTLARKKKIFADSSFYDDPEQKYPTIEEQIKMARKVALSLSAPDNVSARGQRMFLKRKEKANLWSTDQALEGSPAFIPQSRPTGGRKHKKTEHDNPYYNPTPWSGPQTKKVERVAWEVAKERLEGHLEDPEASSVAFAKNRLLFERGFESEGQELAAPKKAPSSSNMARQQCVGLTNDLKGMKGKGAKLFAQRRAKAAEEEAAEWQQSESEREVAPTISRGEERRTELNLDSNEETARRLEELISISKANLSPWETRQNVSLPWQNAAAAAIDFEEGPRKAANNDTFRPGQKTTADIPNFLAKTTSVSSYRPVKFQIPSNGPGPGVTDF